MIGSMPLALTFNESVGLVVITALSTGLVAPVAVLFINDRRLKAQRRFDEDLRRETAFFDAQALFLKDLATAIWDYLEKALAVSYAAQHSPKRFRQVWEAYDQESFALLGGIGSQVSMARILFSSATVEQLQTFYSDWLEDTFDLQLSRLARDKKTTRAQWAAWHDAMHEEAQLRAAALLRMVAEAAELTYEQRRGGGSGAADQTREVETRPGSIDRNV